MDNRYQIKSLFRGGTLTKESYTNAWIELINTLEAGKCVNFSFENEEKNSKTYYNIDGENSILLPTVRR